MVGVVEVAAYPVIICIRQVWLGNEAIRLLGNLLSASARTNGTWRPPSSWVIRNHISYHFPGQGYHVHKCMIPILIYINIKMSSFQHHIIVAIDFDTLLFVLIIGMMMSRVHSKGACIVVSCKYICMGEGEGGGWGLWRTKR